MNSFTSFVIHSNSNLIWPFKIVGNELEIGFKYDLHRDRFEANSNKDLFVAGIKEVLGESLKIITKTLKPSELAEIIMAKEAQVNAQNPPTGVKVTEDNILDQVINSFGGQVIEDE